jgi:hypothetical protein
VINKKFYFLAGAIALSLLTGQKGQAFPWGKVTVTDGDGDQMEIKRGILGDKKTLVEDRYGDKFEKKQSLFGLTKTTQVEALGNGAKHHHGLFGTHHTEVHTMLGDSVSDNRNIFGWHSVHVDAHGLSSFLDELDGKKPFDMSSNLPQNALTNSGQFNPTQHFDPVAPNPPTQP